MVNNLNIKRQMVQRLIMGILNKFHDNPWSLLILKFLILYIHHNCLLTINVLKYRKQLLS